MPKTEFTHQTRLFDCLIQWNGARGNVLATSPDGKTKEWTDNPDGKALGEAMRWCRLGCPEEKPTTKPTTKAKSQNKAS